MAKSARTYLKENTEAIKQMLASGYTVQEIANIFKVDTKTLYEVMRWMGFSFKKTAIDESKLVYADNTVNIEKIVIYGNWTYKNGKRYRVNRLLYGRNSTVFPEVKHIKEKMVAVFVILLMISYIAFAMCYGHREWQAGVSRQQIEREDLLIW